MTSFPASRRVPLLVSAAVCAALIVAVLVWLNTRGDPRPGVTGQAAGQAAEAVSAQPSAPATWKTIEYRGVRVEVPISWERSDVRDCEFQFEQWAPPGSSPCDFTSGAVFYASATFDPAHRPGVRKEKATWAGWVYAGDYAVYAVNTERDLVQRVLDSAR